MIAAMGIDEVLAIARLRQWASDRCAVGNPKTRNYERHGWQQRDNRGADARLVRVIDFERAMNRLTSDQQAVLVLRYRDKEQDPRIALALGCSTRKIGYLLPEARRQLAAELDRLNLL